MITYWVLNQVFLIEISKLSNIETLKSGYLKQIAELVELIENNVIFEGMIAVKNMQTLCALFMRSDNEIDYLSELNSLFENKHMIVEGDIQKLLTLDLSYDEVDISYGTEFQQQVWKEMLKIPYGETCTYSQLAAAIGKPKAFRAVANACGANNLAVIYPCHRVLHKNANNSGYRWGSMVKQAILDYEKVTSIKPKRLV